MWDFLYVEVYNDVWSVLGCRYADCDSFFVQYSLAQLIGQPESDILTDRMSQECFVC